MKKHGKISKGILILIIVICVLAVLVASAVGVYFFDKQNKINQEKSNIVVIEKFSFKYIFNTFSETVCPR